MSEEKPSKTFEMTDDVMRLAGVQMLTRGHKRDENQQPNGRSSPSHHEGLLLHPRSLISVTLAQQQTLCDFYAYYSINGL
jgi:hypothetical protein